MTALFYKRKSFCQDSFRPDLLQIETIPKGYLKLKDFMMNIAVRNAPMTIENIFAHSLDPMFRGDFGQAANIIRDHYNEVENPRVKSVELDEPSKDIMRGFKASDPIQRTAHVNVYQGGQMGIWQGKANLQASKVVAETFRVDTRLQEALGRRRLLDEVDYLCANPWTVDDFVNQSTGQDAIATSVAKNRPLENTAIVLWHTFGLHHLPGPEDHPVQPCISCSFKLMPSNFFDQNPVIDLPHAKNEASCCSSHKPKT